ncbi:MAG: 16S rRNA (guanine(527)-N(7))-methyltransferase RsmG [Deltaproteobacteria bacterium]|nr:16S rRNA (guanine(527)-N(7))-methyltransferase RsmG [Deltaproteobacteria bacterium]
MEPIESKLCDTLGSALAALELPQEDEVVRSLVQYWCLVMDENRIHNLVSRKCGVDEGLVVHVADSLTALKFDLPVEGLKVLDFGSGAGLPGIPLKIARPGWEMVLAESKVKKAGFLTRATLSMRLKKIYVYSRYIGQYGKAPGLHGPFDLITARAVDRVIDLAEKIVPLLKKDGFFLAFKGPAFKDEIVGTYNSIADAGLKLERIEEFVLPFEVGHKRTLLLFRKVL